MHLRSRNRSEDRVYGYFSYEARLENFLFDLPRGKFSSLLSVKRPSRGGYSRAASKIRNKNFRDYPRRSAGQLTFIYRERPLRNFQRSRIQLLEIRRAFPFLFPIRIGPNREVKTRRSSPFRGMKIARNRFPMFRSFLRIPLPSISSSILRLSLLFLIRVSTLVGGRKK